MARKKREAEAPKGSPAWMTTFSDLMNLLLCFFVLLFSMSTVDAEKLQAVIASFQTTVSILPSGGQTIGEGEMIGNGINQLEEINMYLDKSSGEEGEHQSGNAEETGDLTDAEISRKYQEQALAESEQMQEEIEAKLYEQGLQNQVEVDYNAEYVKLTLNGAILFDSGSAELHSEAEPMIEKIAAILQIYDKNIIEIEGHTDNVPMHSERYENNDVLSMYRALSVADFIRQHTTLQPAYIKSAGRGEYVPIGDNTTEEGRAINRRVEIKVYNSYNSQI